MSTATPKEILGKDWKQYEDLMRWFYDRNIDILRYKRLYFPFIRLKTNFSVPVNTERNLEVLVMLKKKIESKDAISPHERKKGKSKKINRSHWSGIQ